MANFGYTQVDNSGGIIINTVPTLDNIPQTLVDRIRIQKGRPVLDLSLCIIKNVPLDTILIYHGAVDDLDLSYNSICSLPPKFALRLGTMTKLNLKRNFIVKLPDNFGYLDQLVRLNISSNQLKTLPLSMSKMKKLQYLNIEDNPFRSPLCNVLDREFLSLPVGNVPDEDKGAVVAHTIVSLLTELSENLLGTSVYAVASSQREGLPIENGDEFTDEDGNANDDGPEMEHGITTRGGTFGSRYGSLENHTTRRQREMLLSGNRNGEHKEISPWRKLLLGVVAFAASVLLFPLIMALMYDGASLERVAAQYDITHIWEMYRGFHNFGEGLLKAFHINPRPGLLHFATKPPPSVPEEIGGFFSNVYASICSLFAKVLQVVRG